MNQTLQALTTIPYRNINIEKNGNIYRIYGQDCETLELAKALVDQRITTYNAHKAGELDPYERWQLETYNNILSDNNPANDTEDDEDIRFERWQELIEVQQQSENYNY